jgi:hypothetical protein
MVKFCRVFLASALFVGVFEVTSGYSLLPPSLINKRIGRTFLASSILSSTAHPEFTVVGEEGEQEEHISLSDSNDVVVVNVEEPSKDDSSQSSSQRPEYGALSPGTVVQVQVGDLSLARKAWKKRRRTGSPLLVPCSVLNVDRQSMVRWNLIYLLEKFGQSKKDGIEISATELTQRYRSFMQSSLQVC